MIHEKAIDSTAIRALKYDDIEESLIVEFTHGRAYTYLSVTLADFEEFLSSKSKGRHYRQFCKQFGPGIKCD